MNFITKIALLTNLSDEARTHLEKSLERFEFEKNENVFAQGKICNYLFFINTGLMRSFYFTENKEVTNWLAAEDDLCTSYYSFISRKPSYETIQCLENCEVEAISYSKLNETYRLFPETERAGRLILEEYYSRLEERMTSIQFKSARERYHLFYRTRPDIANRAPLGHIASYLGMTQETLSRVRAEL